MNDIHPTALFRLSVIGALINRMHIEHGELKAIIVMLAAKPYHIPHSKNAYLSEKTIEGWYYAYKTHNIAGLTPKERNDCGSSKISPDLQELILQVKRDNPKRSIIKIIHLLEIKGDAPKNTLTKSSVHRLLRTHDLSSRSNNDDQPEEHRSFVSEFANDLWQGDVMHGPKISLNGRLRKTYLVSLMDDASRLITHSAFYLGESAKEIEGALKQAILKRGLPAKIIIDNGAAYRSGSLQGICARLEIKLAYCRPYHPEGKGKLERWHRTVRDQFLTEVDFSQIRELDDLNARLWVWLDQSYHRTIHGGLKGMTPITRYQQDLKRIKPIGLLANKLDSIFYHRHLRKVRKDGTIAFMGDSFEVPYELVGKKIVVVVNPIIDQPVAIESTEGKSLGEIVELDAVANTNRHRTKPNKDIQTDDPASSDKITEIMYNQHCDNLKSTFNDNEK